MEIKKEKKIPLFSFLFVGKQTKITNKTRRTGEIANHSRLVVSRETISSEWQNHLGTFFFIIKSQSMESCFLSEKKTVLFFSSYERGGAIWIVYDLFVVCL